MNEPTFSTNEADTAKAGTYTSLLLPEPAVSKSAFIRHGRVGNTNDVHGATIKKKMLTSSTVYTAVGQTSRLRSLLSDHFERFDGVLHIEFSSRSTSKLLICLTLYCCQWHWKGERERKGKESNGLSRVLVISES